MIVWKSVTILNFDIDFCILEKSMSKWPYIIKCEHKLVPYILRRYNKTIYYQLSQEKKKKIDKDGKKRDRKKEV